MSNARNLADIVTGNFDVPLGALDNVPPSNDASALTTGTLDTARLAYTPVNKAGDTITGNLVVGSNLVRTETHDIISLWRAAEERGSVVHNNDGGGTGYGFYNGIVKVTNNSGGHGFTVGKVDVTAGSYRIEVVYKATNQQHSWNVYGSNGNEFTVGIASNAAWPSYTTYAAITAVLPNNADYSKKFLSVTADLSAGTYVIWMSSNPYTGGGYQHYLESIKLVQVK
jgi:hypothetical protein